MAKDYMDYIKVNILGFFTLAFVTFSLLTCNIGLRFSGLNVHPMRLRP